MSLDFFKRYFFGVVLIGLIGCQPDDDTPIVVEETINGFWLAADKGYIVEFTDGQDVMYNINTSGCSILDQDFKAEELAGLTLDMINANELIGSSELIASDIKFTRLENQNEFCLPDQISKTKDPKVNFDHFWNIFNDYYAFFEARNIDWAQYESLRNQVTADNLYDTIEELALLLEDGHVSIYDDELGIEIESGDVRLLERLNANLSGDLVIQDIQDYYDLGNEKLITIVTEYLGGNFEIDDRDNIIWGLIDDNTGYINVLTMEGYGTGFSDELSTLNTILDTIMDDLAASGVSKLVLDLRFNEGGIDTVALDIASRIMDQERLS